MHIDLSNKRVIVTGASRGIGHATVKRFSTAGWRVITCSRQPFPEDCPWDAGPDDHIVVDLASSEDTHQAIAQMKEKLKAQGSKLHALVNNAAISPKKPGGVRLNTLETSEHDWKTVFQINFFAPVMLARGLMDELVAAKGDAWALYDLKTDRAEQNDLSAKMPEKVKELAARWEAPLVAGAPAVMAGRVTPSSSSFPVTSSPDAVAFRVEAYSVSTRRPRRTFELAVFETSA